MSDRRIIIVGASGHGKVIADIACLCGYSSITFLDDDPELNNCGKYPVIGRVGDLPKYHDPVIVAIGNADIRKSIMEKYSGCHFISLQHPDSTVAEDVTMGRGSVVMAGAVINPGAVIGDGVIINTCASVDHDCVVGNYVHVSVGSHLCGNVTVSDGSWIGAGAVIINNITIHSRCMIGAGAIVTQDIEGGGTYVGVPARRVK